MSSDTITIIIVGLFEMIFVSYLFKGVTKQLRRDIDINRSAIEKINYRLEKLEKLCLKE